MSEEIKNIEKAEEIEEPKKEIDTDIEKLKKLLIEEFKFKIIDKDEKSFYLKFKGKKFPYTVACRKINNTYIKVSAFNDFNLSVDKKAELLDIINKINRDVLLGSFTLFEEVEKGVLFVNFAVSIPVCSISKEYLECVLGSTSYWNNEDGGMSQIIKVGL